MMRMGRVMNLGVESRLLRATSSKEYKKASSAPAMMPGRARGMVILKNT